MRETDEVARAGVPGVLDTGLLHGWGQGARALSLTATVREAHRVALHFICLSFDTPISATTGLAGA